MTERSSSSDQPVDFAKWFIAVGVVGAVVIGWFAMGQTGRPLKDGDYGCSAGPLAVGGGPGATVENGEVVDVWKFNMNTGKTVSLRWSDAQRKSPTEFTVTSEVPMLNSGETRHYACTID
jgi:hypothetical protein